MLQQKIRRMKKKNEDKQERKLNEEASEYEILRKLGSKLLPPRFAKLLSAQIDAQIKGNRGKRYDNEFKKFALSLYFLIPEIIKS